MNGEHPYTGLEFGELLENLEQMGIEEPRKKFRKLRHRNRGGLAYSLVEHTGFGSRGTTTFYEIYMGEICIGSFYIHGNGRVAECHNR
jgi:hypothetical protein